MEAWRKTFREGFAPGLSLDGLKALLGALQADDPRLTQGATTSPPPMQCVLDWPCEGACPVGFAGWQAEGRRTVAEVEEYVARACYEADCRLGEPAACRWFLNWWDDTPRGEAVALMRAEVARTLALRTLAESRDALAAFAFLPLPPAKGVAQCSPS